MSLGHRVSILFYNLFEMLGLLGIKLLQLSRYLGLGFIVLSKAVNNCNAYPCLICFIGVDLLTGQLIIYNLEQKDYCWLHVLCVHLNC